jgi:DMSO/TMAO reductase YedYZ molybdopterin-dependent catalytic subunit
MDIISRGFSGRRSAADVKLPAGQYLTTDFPVLSAGPTPHVSLERWEFVIDDGTNVLRRWDWKAFRDLPTETFVVDLHCVTRWSKLGTFWEDVSLDTLLKDVKTDASHAMARSYGGYTTNLPCEPPLWERRLKDEGSYRLLQHLRQCLPYGYSCC